MADIRLQTQSVKIPGWTLVADDNKGTYQQLRRGMAFKKPAAALLAGVCALALLTVFGCGGGGASQSSSTNNDPPPLTPTVTIASPANNAVLTTSPVTLSLTISGTTQFKALLDGIDITSQFSAISNGKTQATVTQPAINFGKNQLQITAGTQQASVAFVYNPAAVTVPGATSSSSPALYVPITTRVLLNGGDGSHYGDWGIVVGDNTTPGGIQTYQAQKTQDGGSIGFQVLRLTRSNLTLVDNTSWSTSNSGDLLNFVSQVLLPNQSSPAQCGHSGCLLVIQSLGQIGQNCAASFNTTCALYLSSLAGIGATQAIAYVNGSNAHVGYSFIGNTGSSGVNPGTYYERLTCSDSNKNNNGTCDKFYTQPNYDSQISMNLPGGQADLSNTAPSGATADQIGNISGALVLDNYSNYTFMPTTRQVSFSIVHGPSASAAGASLITVDNQQGCCGSSQLPSVTFQRNGQNYTQVGGFQLVVVDATTLQVIANATYTIPWVSSLPQGVENLRYLPSDLTNLFYSRRCLFFLTSIGDLTHDYPYGDGSGVGAQDVWDSVAQTVYSMGGTWEAFEQTDQADNPDPINTNATGLMDYTLVGEQWTAASNIGQPYGAEAASTISRQNILNPVPSNMEGILKVDHQGYYEPSNFSQYSGLLPSVVATLTSASLLPNTGWPLTGSAGTPGDNAAYTWISQQLCCDDIRSAYSNLNIDPDVWLTEIYQLNGSNQSSFTQQEFSAVQGQLAQELAYVAEVRELQNNIVSLYQDQQSNLSLILQQAQDTVIANLDLDESQPVSQPPLLSYLQDGLNVAGPIGGLAGLTQGPAGVAETVGIQTAVGLATNIVSYASEQTNDGDGTPLIQKEKTEIAAGQLAQSAADDFALSLISLGNSFDRAVSDWNRLKAVGAALDSNELPWDGSAAGLMLQAYDLAARRQMYTKLLAPTYTVEHYQNGDVTGNRGDAHGYADCELWNFMDNNNSEWWGFWPNTKVDGPTSGLDQPPPGRSKPDLAPQDLWWDLWLIVQNEHVKKCPDSGDTDASNPTLFHMFDPIDPNDSTPLGIYKPWFFHRSGIPIQDYPGDSDVFTQPFIGDNDLF
jgi:hypothetical protein